MDELDDSYKQAMMPEAIRLFKAWRERIIAGDPDVQTEIEQTMNEIIARAPPRYNIEVHQNPPGVYGFSATVTIYPDSPEHARLLREAGFHPFEKETFTCVITPAASR